MEYLDISPKEKSYSISKTNSWLAAHSSQLLKKCKKRTPNYPTCDDKAEFFARLRSCSFSKIFRRRMDFGVTSTYSSS